MATKWSDLSSEKKFPVADTVNSNFAQFANLNLNQNQKYLETSSTHSKSISTDDKNKRNYASSMVSDLIGQDDLNNRSKNCVLYKKDQSLNPLSTTEYSNIFESPKEQKKEDSSITKSSSSTLSLHIAAYENAVEVAAAEDEKLLSKEAETKNQNIDKTGKAIKKLFSNSKPMNSFEIPRQQKDENVSEPEIMQFKASQKLLDPNQQKASSNATTKKEEKVDAEFKKIKEDANKLFKAGKYNEAVEAYNQILLRFRRLSDTEKAVIYSNRCAAYLMLNEEDLTTMAKYDAEYVIRLWPTWWRGYFRMGRVQAVLEEWHEAEKSFEKSLALNSESQETRDELSAVRAQIGRLSRNDKIDFSSENKMLEIAGRLGIPLEKIKEVEDKALNTPGLGDNLRSEYYRDGSRGYKQDYKKAFEYYLKAAQHELPDAMYNLGRMYQNGRGVKRDYKEAMKWLLKAASAKPTIMNGSGIAEAQHLLGLNYSEGVGVDKDYQKAAKWYEKAVQNGYAPSANNLGLLYQEGHGVQKDATKAFNYFKFAAQKGETPPMINLANCYFNADGTGSIKPSDEDIAEGKKWLRLAAEKGDIEAAQELKKRENLPSEMYMIESFQNFMLQDMFPKRNPLNYEEFGKYIEEAARKGSLTAQRHMEIWKNFDDAMKAFKKNDSGGVVAALSKACHLDFQIAKFPDLFNSVIEERIQSHPHELDAAVCYLHINSKNPSASFLIDHYSSMFPNDDFFTEMLYSKCIILNDLDRALKIADSALKRQPTSLRLLYCRAIALCQMESQPSECIKALDAFLAVAPKDHDKVPGCHYRKAMYYFYHKNMPNFIASFEAGLAAEKEQLPCFLPYFFKFKSIMEAAYMATKQEATAQQAQAFFNPRFQRVKHDVHRKLLLTKNRETFINLLEHIKEESIFENSAVPQNSPKPPSTKNLKKITLKEMDPTKDKVYNGYILEGRIIDWAIPLNGITSIIEDENGDVHRLAIYNWPLTGNKNLDVPKAIKDFHQNFKVSIINPSMKLASDGSNVIRVENPKFIQIDKTSADKQCHFCGKEAKILPCSGCVMAKYCSKECQKFDWTEFNHKRICKHLKMFNQMM